MMNKTLAIAIFGFVLATAFTLPLERATKDNEVESGKFFHCFNQTEIQITNTICS